MGLLDALGIDRAHIVGASMGGMIVQTMAIEHPERVLSLTSIMSTTGDPDVGQPHPEVLPLLLERAPDDREGYIAAQVEGSRVISSPEHFDPERAAAVAGASFDRCFYPDGVGHQLLAILASGSRSDALRELDVNTLVIHGDVDPLVTVSGGERTAEVIPGAELMILEGMGHDVPAFYRAVGRRGHHRPGRPLGRHRLMGPLQGVKILEIAGIGPGPVRGHDAGRHGRRRDPRRPGPVGDGRRSRQPAGRRVEPGPALDRHRPQEPRRGRGAARAWSSRPTRSSRASAPASPSGWASAPTCAWPATPGSSSAA